MCPWTTQKHDFVGPLGNWMDGVCARPYMEKGHIYLTNECC